MCGIIGMAGELTAVDEKAISTLLVLDSLRGTDSTGVAVISRNDEVKVAKGVGDPFQLFDKKEFDKAVQGFNKVIIGHNRFATQGKVSRSNAHPFEFSRIVGVHNGTLTTKWKLRDAAKFTVDSENLYHHINEEGLPSALEVLGGAWALVWWDKEACNLHMLRNKERPLFITRKEDTKVIYWASEEWMLDVALSRSNIKHGEIIQIEEDVLHTFNVGVGGALSKVHVSPAPSRYFPPVSHSQVWVNGVLQNSPTTGGKTATGTSSPTKSQTIPRRTLSLVHTTTYGGSKGLVLEIISEAVDSHGSTYYICMDENNIEMNIRYYFHKEKNGGLVGSLIKCDIGHMNFDNEGSYFKVMNSTVTLMDTTKLLNHKGKEVTYNEWINEYGTCEWCSTPVTPDDVYRLTTDGQCLCATCAPIAKEYVTYI